MIKPGLQSPLPGGQEYQKRQHGLSELEATLSVEFKVCQLHAELQHATGMSVFYRRVLQGVSRGEWL